MKNFVIFVLMAFLTSCMVTIPIRWSSEKEAFPGGNAVESSSPGAMAFRQSILDFPYADVFASAEKAMSFAQINVTESNKASGIIYGTRSVLVRGFTKRFYYVVKVKEEGAERSNVSVYSKQQQSAKYGKWIPNVVIPTIAFAGLGAATMSDYPSMVIAYSAIWPVIFVPVTAILNSSAKKNAALKWSPDDDEYLDRIMSFMRTDLLQK